MLWNLDTGITTLLLLCLSLQHNAIVVVSFTGTIPPTGKQVAATYSSKGSLFGPQQQQHSTTPPLALSSSSAQGVPSSSSSTESNDDDDEEWELDEDTTVVELEDLGDDFNLQKAIVQKELWEKDLQRLVETSAQDPKAIQKADLLFDQMFELYIQGNEHVDLFPDVNVYNSLLEIHAYSKSFNGGELAEEILNRMENKDNTIENIVPPNLNSYLKVIDAWAMRKQPERAQQIIHRLEELYTKQKEEDKDNDKDTIVLKPTTDVYNKLIKAYGMAGNTDKAYEIFNELLQTNEANYKTWLQTMKAYAPTRGGDVKVQELIDQLQDSYDAGHVTYQPTIEAYNTLIRALGHQQDKGGVAKGEALLYELLQDYQTGSTTDETMRPNANTFRTVIQSYKDLASSSSSSSSGLGVKAEQLLQLQEGLYNTMMPNPPNDLKVDLRLYNTVLATIARSKKDNKKASRCQRLIEKMKKRNDPTLVPTSTTYYSLFSACAHTPIGTPEENLNTFQIAWTTMNELRNRKKDGDDLLDSGCMGMMLKSCSNLMPSSKKRDGIVEQLFQYCCTNGLVNDFILKEFEHSASEELQLQVLGGFLEDGVHLPEEWNRNVY